MPNLARAILQFSCEAAIYTCQRILDHLAARRPNMDDPLPDGHTEFAEWVDAQRGRARELARDTDIPMTFWPTNDDSGRMECDGPMAAYPDWLNPGT